MERRDPYTVGHMWRAAQFSTLLGTRLGFDDIDILTLRVGALLHDLGKVKVPLAILHKPGPLDQHEYALVKAHPQIGSELIHRYSLGATLQDMIHHHHETFDGNGYPDALKREEIAVSSRVIAIVDAFDALTSARPYRKNMAPRKALAILAGEKDKQFYGRLVSAFVETPIEDLKPIIGHIPNGMPFVECFSCGPVNAIPRSTLDRDIVRCKVCRGKFRLHRSK
jgi:HD-GYP domain-containing protein (c-di-GMP phosphodiesterase class II)